MKKSARLFQAAQAELDAVKALDAKDELTADEASDRETRMAKARELFEQAKSAKADEELLAAVDEFGAGLGLDVKDGAVGVELPNGGRQGHKTLGQLIIGSKEFGDLLARYPHGIQEKARVQSDPIGVKSLFTGGSDTSGGAFVVPEQSGIVEMLGRRALMIRDVISVRRTGSDSVEYVRQTSHTNAAAPVPEATSTATIGDGTGGTATTVTGGVKPEGSWAFERDSAAVKTIAEWVPATKRALADVAALEGLINDELRADLAEEEEDQIVSGNGTGENLTGILNVSGTQAQAFDTDIFRTVRKALTKAKTVGRVRPNAVGLNPADVETIDLARDAAGGAGTGQFLGQGPFAMGPRTLWGVPVLETEAIPAGTAVVGDWSKAVLWDREQASVTMTDSHADFFIRNLVAILAEERVAFAVTRPTAFVVAALA